MEEVNKNLELAIEFAKIAFKSNYPIHKDQTPILLIDRLISGIWYLHFKWNSGRNTYEYKYSIPDSELSVGTEFYEQYCRERADKEYAKNFFKT